MNRKQMTLLGVVVLAVALSSSARADLAEGFDDITALPAAGWHLQNNSAPPGPTDWFQGNPDAFPAHSGATNSYIGANFNNCGDHGTISNWLVTPQLTLENGNTLTFWTRCPDPPSTYPDRMQVRMSTAGNSTNVGTLPEDVGDFTEVLLDINPTEQQGVYPSQWTEYTITLAGLGGPTSGLAFRYYVHDSGLQGTAGDYIGIDTFMYAEGGGVPRMFLDGPDYSPWQPVTDPTAFPWHELWPVFCTQWDCVAWTDNGSGVLDECDFMEFADGSTWHVDNVTVTAVIEEIEGGPVEDYIYVEWVTPPYTGPLGDWVEIVPTLGIAWTCVDWIDNGNGVLDGCDWMIMDSGAGQLFFHVVSLATDIEVFEEAGPDPCPADINGDNVVDVLDLLAVLAAWGDPGGVEDINGDGIVDVLDLLELLAAWGPCPGEPMACALLIPPGTAWN